MSALFYVQYKLIHIPAKLRIGRDTEYFFRFNMLIKYFATTFAADTTNFAVQKQLIRRIKS